MQEAAAYLEGEHDFKSFCQTGAQVESTVRTIYSVEVEEQGENDLVLLFSPSGTGSVPAKTKYPLLKDTENSL